MIGSDGLDDYDGEYDSLAAEVLEARAAQATEAVARVASHGGFDLDHNGRWTGKGYAPERPWWCAHCHAPPQTESDRLFGVCGGCAARDRAQRERAKASAEVSMGGPAPKHGRRAA